MKTYRKGYTAKGIVTTTALGALATAGILYGAQSCSNALDAVRPEERSPYERIVEDYGKLDADARERFLGYAWESTPAQIKARIVGDELGVKVSEIYGSGLEGAVSR